MTWYANRSTIYTNRLIASLVNFFIRFLSLFFKFGIFPYNIRPFHNSYYEKRLKKSLRTRISKSFTTNCSREDHLISCVSSIWITYFRKKIPHNYWNNQCVMRHIPLTLMLCKAIRRSSWALWIHSHLFLLENLKPKLNSTSNIMKLYRIFSSSK